MTIQPIIDSLSRLEKLHQSLLLLAQEKTEALKSGGFDQLQKVLVQERKYVQAINQVEKSRQQAVGDWLRDHSKSLPEPTVSYLLELIPDTAEKQSLEKHFLKLTDVILRVKQQEQLNQELMLQSLQYIELSLDMLDPSLKNLNYSQTKSQPASQQSRSMFDSKA